VSNRARLYLLFLQIFVFQAGFGLVVPVLPLYAREFGLGPAGIGVVIGVYGLARVLTDLPAAWLASRIGHSRAMGIGALVLTVGSALTGLAGSLPELILWRFVTGAGAATTLVVGQSMAAAHPEPFSRPRAIAYYQSAFLAGVGLGPILGGPLADALGLQAPFLAYAVLAGAVGLTGLLVRMPAARSADAGSSSPHTSARGYLLMLRDLPFLFVSLITLMMHFTRTGALEGMAPLLGAEQFLMSTTGIGVALGLNGLSNLVVTFATARLAERVDRKALLIPGSVLQVASLAVFALGAHPSLFVAAAVLWGCGTGLTGPVTAIYVAERANGDVTGSLALYRMLSDVGYLAGPLLMGLSATHVGTPVTFLWCAGLILAVVAAFRLVTSPRRAPNERLLSAALPVPPLPSVVTHPSARRSPMSRIDGPLYAEVAGPVDAPPMVFVHPNPMDSACWLYQMAHFSTWYRCIAIDLPGYGRSPGAQPGLTMEDIADACWEVVDRVTAREGAVLVGCSVGSTVVQHMYHRRPKATDAVILSGTGWHEVKDFPRQRIAAYREFGIDYRYDYTLQDMSPEFRRTPMAHWLAGLFTERNGTADLETIVRMFEALAVPDPDWLQADLAAPVLILSGSLDGAHAAAFALRDRLPSVEMVVLQDAGHACHIEQPWVYDAEIIRFLAGRGHTRLPVTPPTDAGQVGPAAA
jgi:pimeloyl-ACP methyl ester carboxylesterase/predicted MFS family arabinose efflux permease